MGDIAEKVERKAPENSNAPVMMISASSGFINQSEKYSTDNAGSSLAKYTLLKFGELAYNHGFSKLRNFGSCFDLKVEEARIPFVYHSFALPNDDPKFFATYLNSGIFDRDLKKLVSSSARMDGLLNISYEQYMSLDIFVPTLPEQQAIGEFFKQLDDTIAFHQRTQKKYQNLKKSYLEKMFAKINYAWKQRKLGELYENNLERNIQGIGYDKTLSIATMTYKTSGNGASATSLNDYKVLRLGDIAFEGHTNKQFKYGRFVLNDVGVGLMSPRFTALRPKKEMPILFWKYYIHHEPVMKKILVNSTKSGTMMNELVISEFLKQEILVPPSETEQQAIGEFFKQLDDTIAFHQRELEKYQQLKQVLLDQLFV